MKEKVTEKELKVVVLNPLTKEQEKELTKRVEDYLSIIYSNTQKGSDVQMSKQEKMYCKLGQAVAKLSAMTLLAILLDAILIYGIMFQEGEKKMDRCTQIHLWFEETNAKLQQKWLSIKAKNNRAKCESKDELSKRNVELARLVRNLQEENKELRFENEEQKILISKIKKLIEQNTYDNETVILRKIKELVCDYQSIN